MLAKFCTRTASLQALGLGHADAHAPLLTCMLHAATQVDALIEEEMKSSTKKPADYLRELPPVPGPKFEGHPMLAAEYER